MSGTSTSDKKVLTKTSFTFLLETYTKLANYMNQQFLKHCSSVKERHWSPWLPQITTLRDSPGHSAGKQNAGRAQKNLQGKKM